LKTRRGVDRDKPGLYEWKIIGVGSYIGQYTNFSDRTKKYHRNVLNLLNARPHRPDNPIYRPIHYALAFAVLAHKQINLIALENVPRGKQLTRREHELIRERGTLNGGTRRR